MQHCWRKANWVTRQLSVLSVVLIRCACKQVMTDFHACRWPNDLPQEQVAEFMDRLNDSAFVDLEHHLEDDLPIITFSHFVPLQVCRNVLASF